MSEAPARARGHPQAGRREVRVREWEPAMVPVDPNVLAPLASRSRSFSISPCPGGSRLLSQGIIGVAVIGDMVLRIEPKIPALNILALVDYAERGVPWDESDPQASTTTDFVSLVAELFLRRAARVARIGWVRSYVECEDALTAVRGRVLVDRQLRRSPAALATIECRFEDFELDVAPNRFVLCALNRIVTGSAAGLFSSHQRAQARAIARSLAGVTPTADYRAACRVAHADRRFMRYRSLLPIAELIVKSGSFGGSQGAAAMGGFLLDLAPIFEAAVGRAFQKVNPGTRLQHRVNLDERRKLEIRPDVVVMKNSAPAFIADAKYKDPVAGTPRVDDVQQVVTYLARLGVERGALIYPGTSDAAGDTIVVPAFERRLVVEVRRVKVDGALGELAASLERAAGVPAL